MVTEFIQAILDWIVIHPTHSGFIVFLAAFAESLAFIGIIFPGAFLMFGFGAIVASGAMDLTTTLFWAISGAIIGDFLSFGLGYRFRDRLRSVWPFRRYPELLAYGMNFFHYHGAKSIFFGRFVGPVRPLIPLIAGMLGMSVPRFIVVDILAAFSWAPAYLFPGMIFAASLNLAAVVVTRLVIIISVGISVIWLAIITVQHLLRFLHTYGTVLSTARLNFTHFKARAVFLLGVGLIAGGLFFARLFFVPDGLNIDLSLADWQENGYRSTLPSDSRDRPKQTLNLQWVGSLETIRDHLITAGWYIPPALSINTLFQMIAPNPDAEKLPLLPQIINGQFDALRLTFASPNGQWLVIRLWDSTMRISHAPLWIGYVNCLELGRPIPWLTIWKTRTCLPASLDILKMALPNLDIRIVQSDAESQILLIK